ncbi:nuclear transport factor 2 family protein [Sphingomonas canadensis]|uniref:Nuclear transport factor 2 family protein n=1 Tax=Sphingomonas canadensis TaxID=1219257 RepID=A0ABW3HB40_9SPHN|nr:nuclear transport factor 2 family protein [Sphingomonas canadensis]MCW3838338.1 nuclear transport factor 2 family protein [Sphingomonas canadensis]
MGPRKRAMAMMTGLLGASCTGPADTPPGPPPPPAAAETPLESVTNYARLLMVEHKPHTAFARYFAPNLIQHDPWIGDGSEGDHEFLEARREAEPGQHDALDQYVTVIHTILADGDLVAIKSHVFTSPVDPGREFVDMWQVKDGKFIEHWDVIQPLPVGGVNPRPVGCGVGLTYAAAKAVGDTVANPVCGAPDRSVDSAESRRIVLAYMALGQQPGKMEEAVNTYLAEDFVQHSPNIPPGRDGLIAYLAARGAARSADNRRSHIARVIADGDMVMVHRRVTSDSDPRGIAYIDLFRLRGGRIAEHWDVVQPIPEFSVSGRSMVDGPLEPGRYKGGPKPE